ncbi:hypothetical protein ACIOEX_22775, partial [Streptomyces sp. NPDC087850]
MTTHSGQGDEPRQSAARPAHEGVILPSDGSGPFIPGATDQDPPARETGTSVQPWGLPEAVPYGVPQPQPVPPPLPQ